MVNRLWRELCSFAKKKLFLPDISILFPISSSEASERKEGREELLKGKRQERTMGR